MSTQWVEVLVDSGLDAGELLAVLEDPWIQGAWQEDQAIRLYWPAERWTSERNERLACVLRQLEGSGKPSATIVVRTIPDEHWNRKWAESVTPLVIGTRIVIRPSWESPAVQSGQIEIVLDPKQAFGTGHHATTRLLLERLAESIQGGESILDVGTGSGILAMAALRLGAARATGIDHDSVAIDCAKEYAALNGFGDELVLRCGSLSGGEPSDVVLANLDRATLLLLAPALALATRRRLLVSGVLTDHREEIAAAFAGHNLYPVWERESEGWVALEFGHPECCEGR
ncbi:MAG TPA: 50S ribosomal protein L11 methyltransferase [Nitrospira sp.]|nr:50S ribosomal protein L11 methyltransferase [Nitrospira sp.]